MAIVGRAKYTRARARNFEETRREGSAKTETESITGVDSGLCTVARLLTGNQERANQSLALGMYALNSNSLA